MPELPDLEIFKDNIFKKLTSKRLTGLKVYSQKITTPEVHLSTELTGTELTAITRHGKELFFDFADSKIISVHLMLNGRISMPATPAAAEKIRGKVLALNFENESVIFHDTGSIGTVIKYKPATGKVPDALGENFTPEYFIKAAQKKPTSNIKAFLIDQKIIKGIGTAYADEILWAARISPKSTTGKIPQESLLTLHAAIITTLLDAIASIREISPDIISGEERSFLKVHTRLKKQTETAYPIKIETIATKTTYFTEEQILWI
jgi:formamidopyrimidine-DNA glycosylase